MSRYKVLPLPTEFEDAFAERYFEDPWDRPNKIDPVFNRPGLYYDREKNICWVETTHGCWIIGDKEKYESELEYQAQDQFILHDDVVKALQVLKYNRLLPKELELLWQKHRYAVALRGTYRGSRKWRLKTLGK